MKQPRIRNICVCFSAGVSTLLNCGPFFPLLELHPSAGTNAVNSTLLREGPPPVGTKAGQNPPRGNYTHTQYSIHHTQQKWCTSAYSHVNTADKFPHAHTAGYMEIIQNWIKLFTSVYICLSPQCYINLIWMICHFLCHCHSSVVPIYQVTESADSCPGYELYPVIIM